MEKFTLEVESDADRIELAEWLNLIWFTHPRSKSKIKCSDLNLTNLAQAIWDKDKAELGQRWI